MLPCWITSSVHLTNTDDFMELINEKYEGIDGKFLNFFDKDFFAMCNVEKAKELIAEELLGNKNVVYSIFTGEPENVLTALKGTAVTADAADIESFYGTRFNTVSTNLDVKSLDSEKMVGVCNRSDGELKTYYMNDPDKYVLLIDFSTHKNVKTKHLSSKH